MSKFLSFYKKVLLFIFFGWGLERKRHQRKNTMENTPPPPPSPNTVSPAVISSDAIVPASPPLPPPEEGEILRTVADPPDDAVETKNRNDDDDDDDDDDAKSSYEIFLPETPPNVTTTTTTQKEKKKKAKKEKNSAPNPNAKERKLWERGPYDGITLMTLIQRNLLKSGRNNVLASYEYEGEKIQVVGSLTENGHIYVEKEDQTFRNPRSLSMDVKRRLNTEIKFTEGWGHVRYMETGWRLDGKNDENNGQTLKEIREKIPIKDVPSLVPRWKRYVPKVAFVPKKNKNPFPERAWNAPNTESVKFPPGTIVFVETTKKPKKKKGKPTSQIWTGRVWKLRHCLQKHQLWDEHPCQGEKPCALIYLYGKSRKFMWANDCDMTRFDDASKYAEKVQKMFSDRHVSKLAEVALEQAEKEVAEEFLEPWTTSDDEHYYEGPTTTNRNTDDDAVGENDTITIVNKEEENDANADKNRKIDQLDANLREGLTPDWIIEGCYKVFGLKKPTIEVPYVKDLLDPCTNSLSNPNIPAEVLYDKSMNGLLSKNSWNQKFVLLNPPYETQTQWRFIHRAINEVEWGHSKGILLVCRNSTDTNYFQKLLPFPRVMLRRNAIQFKDYTSSPIGFGIAVFCMVAPGDADYQRETYARFYDEFASAGEFNVPCDRAFASSKAFTELVERLHRQAAESQRDSFVACDNCDRWRELSFEQMQEAMKKKRWTCDLVFEEGCETPLSRREKRAFIVSAKDGDRIFIAGKNEGLNVPGFIQAREEDVDGDREEDEEKGERRSVEQKPTSQTILTTQHEPNCRCNWPPCIARRAHREKMRRECGLNSSDESDEDGSDEENDEDKGGKEISVGKAKKKKKKNKRIFIPDDIEEEDADILAAHLTKAERERLRSIEKNRVKFEKIFRETENEIFKRQRLLRESEKVALESKKMAETFEKTLAWHKVQVDRFAVRSDSLKKALASCEKELKTALEKESECAKQTEAWRLKRQETEKGAQLLREKYQLATAELAEETTSRRIDAMTAKREAEKTWTRVSERVKKAKTAAMIDNNNDKKDDKEMPNVETPPLLQQLQPRQQQIRRQNMTTSLKCGKGRKLCFGCSAVVGSPTRVCPHCKTTLPRVAVPIPLSLLTPTPSPPQKSLEPPPSSSPPPSPPLSLPPLAPQLPPPLGLPSKKQKEKTEPKKNKSAPKAKPLATKKKNEKKKKRSPTLKRKKTTAADNRKMVAKKKSDTPKGTIADLGCGRCRYSRNGCSRCRDRIKRVNSKKKSR